MKIAVDQRSLEIARQGLSSSVDLLNHAATMCAKARGLEAIPSLESLRAWTRVVEKQAAEIELAEVFSVSPADVHFDYDTNEFFANKGAVRVRVEGFNGVSPNGVLRLV
jgi:hypothetical protein